MKLKIYLLYLLIFSFLFYNLACEKVHSDENNKVEKHAEISAINVKTTQVELSKLTETIIISGETFAHTDSKYSAEIPGRVEKLTVDLGARVKKGQLLARIDYEMLDAQAKQAEANSNVAKKVFTRLKVLKDENLAPEQQVDEAEARLIQSEAQLKIAMANLQKSMIRSGINGIVARKFVEQGEFVGPGSPIFQVVNFSTIVIKAQLPENQVSKIIKGAPVSVYISALDQEFQGNVQIVLPAAHHLSKTFQLRVKVKNPEFKILIGMSARVSIVTKIHNEVIVVLQDVVIEEGKQRIVFVNNNGIAQKREVSLGATENDKVIITSGLNKGDSLIITGHRELVDGQKVKVIE